ncbi:MAG: XdhC family protein [Verrucomicrobia bacterium]|nr:XdhC family protein [Verrucomicrobiota bacterium]
MDRFYASLARLLGEGQPFALGIITGIKGSSPQKKGAKALFFDDGRIVGTMGGGCLEAEIQDRARQALRTQEPATFDLVLDHDFGWDDGLICGGKVRGVILPRAAEVVELWRRLAACDRTITWGVKNDFSIGEVKGNDDEWLYTETVSPPCALWIAGSGHIAQAVAPLALQLEFDVTVFDDRPALANTQFFPKATQFRVGYWDDLLAEALPPRPAFGLIVTRGHQHDALVLRHWIQRPFAFLGMIGSSRKKRLIFSQFVEDKLATEEQLAKVACPVGLDICAVSPHEIAVSILAQYVQKRAELLHPQLLAHRRPAAVAAGESPH